MAATPEPRPTFSAILQDLSNLLQASDDSNAEPFGIYQNLGACDGPAPAMCPEPFLVLQGVK